MRRLSLLVRVLTWLLAFLYPLQAFASDALFDAVCEGNEQINAALANGASIDALDGAGQTPLHALFRCGISAGDPGFLQAPRILLDAGASVDAKDYQGRTPLMAALEPVVGPSSAVNLYIDGARLLLARGADVHTADHTGITPLHLSAAEPNAIVTQLLISLGADTTTEDQSGRTPLLYALAGDNNLDTFALLLRQLDEQDFAKQAVALATETAAKNLYGKLDLLLQRQPTLELTLSAPSLTATLEEAVWQGAPLPLLGRLTAAGAEASTLQSRNGRDLAWRLAMLGRTSELTWLTGHGWRINQIPFSGFPSLYFADTRATRILLNVGARPNVTGKTVGTTLNPIATPPLEYGHVAVWRSRERSALLLKAGYSPRADALGRRDLELAVASDDLWLVQQLLQRHAPAKAQHASLITLALNQGRLPLLQAVLRTTKDTLSEQPILVTQYLLSDTPQAIMLEALLIAGADANSRHTSTEPALLVAARREQWELVKLLIRYGANSSLSNAQGCTLLCYEWSMPDNLRAQLIQSAERSWQAPELADQPTVFFTLAMIPTLTLWLLTLAWRLISNQSLFRPTLWMIGALMSAVLIGSALFYRCDPCVLRAAPMQLALTALVAASGYLLCMWQVWHQDLRSR